MCGLGCISQVVLRDRSRRSVPSASNPASLRVGPSCIVHWTRYLILDRVHKLKQFDSMTCRTHLNEDVEMLR